MPLVKAIRVRVQSLAKSLVVRNSDHFFKPDKQSLGSTIGMGFDDAIGQLFEHIYENYVGSGVSVYTAAA